MKEIVEAYEKGVITADHLAVMCLQKIDPKDPSVVRTSFARTVGSHLELYEPIPAWEHEIKSRKHASA